jgi:hypothetical protein
VTVTVTAVTRQLERRESRLFASSGSGWPQSESLNLKPVVS